MAAVTETTRVMIVEEAEELREFLVQTLRKGGYRVVVAGDGGEALALLQSSGVDAIVLDLGLPDMDGHQILRRLRLDPRTIGIPVIAVTTNPPFTPPSLDADCVLFKPVGSGRLLSELERMIGSGAQRPAASEPSAARAPLTNARDRNATCHHAA